MASSKSSWATAFHAECEQPMSAASLTRFARSAPKLQGYSSDLQIISTTSNFLGMDFGNRLYAPSKPGRLLALVDQNAQDNSAGSKLSGRLVAAGRQSPSHRQQQNRPSQSAADWASVLAHRFRIDRFCATCRCVQFVDKNNAGEPASSPVQTNQRTRAAPTQQIIPQTQGRRCWKKDAPASAPTQLAQQGFTVPGGPTNNTPLGT